MPSQITVNDRALTLSPEFRYQHDGGDAIYHGVDQRSDGVSGESKSEEGDWLPDDGLPIFAVSVGSARLMQYSHDELPAKQVPKANLKVVDPFSDPVAEAEEKRDKPKAKSKKSDSKKDSDR